MIWVGTEVDDTLVTIWVGTEVDGFLEPVLEGKPGDKEVKTPVSKKERSSDKKKEAGDDPETLGTHFVPQVFEEVTLRVHKSDHLFRN